MIYVGKVFTVKYLIYIRFQVSFTKHYLIFLHPHVTTALYMLEHPDTLRCSFAAWLSYALYVYGYFYISYKHLALLSYTHYSWDDNAAIEPMSTNSQYVRMIING